MIALALGVGLVLGAVGTVVIGACLASGQAARGAVTDVSRPRAPEVTGTPAVASPAPSRVQAWVRHDGSLHVEAETDEAVVDFVANCL